MSRPSRFQACRLYPANAPLTPQRNHIEAPFAVSRQRFRSLHHQLEMSLAKRPCLRAFSMAENAPSPFLHEMAEIPITRTDIQQASFRVPQIRSISGALASQHKSPYIVITDGWQVPCAYPCARYNPAIHNTCLSLSSGTCCVKKTTRLTAVNRKFFTGGIMVRASHDFLKCVFPAERTCIYIEYIHFIPNLLQNNK